MIHELRIYDATPGRMPDLLNRFQTRVLPIWQRMGLRAVGFWTNVIGPSHQQLTYLMQWESLAERERLWNAFQADAEWLQARVETEANGPIVDKAANSILAPTAFSPLR